MDDIVDRSALGNALQRISELERIAMNQSQSNTAPTASLTDRANSANTARTASLTDRANSVGELYNRFPSLRRPSSSRQLTSDRNVGRSSTSTTSVHNRRARKSNASNNMKPVIRDLVLIPDPNERRVPTHSTRVMLDSQGFVVHGFPFVRKWDARTLEMKIVEAFPKHTLLTFEYMKVG